MDPGRTRPPTSGRRCSSGSTSPTTAAGRSPPDTGTRRSPTWSTSSSPDVSERRPGDRRPVGAGEREAARLEKAIDPPPRRRDLAARQEPGQVARQLAAQRLREPGQAVELVGGQRLPAPAPEQRSELRL